MAVLEDIRVGAEPLRRFVPLVGEERVAELERLAAELRARASDRVVWNVNSTAMGGGVAEMLRTLLAYARGAGIDARWVVIHGSPDFFRVTKRLHNALHGEKGDGSPLDDAARRIYEAAAHDNAGDLLARVRRGDVVLLHDPQTAGLAPYLRRAGARVVWRCHIGADCTNEETTRGWDFLAPYLRHVEVSVFSREAYIPAGFDRARTVVIVPSIDPFSPKNQDMDEATVRAILVHTGLVVGARGGGHPHFLRSDGSPGRVDRYADLLSLGPPPDWDSPLVVQVSRWDDLKDPVGVLRGFALLVDEGGHRGAELVLAGPNVHAVADDPDGARVFGEVTEAWRALPHHVRRTVNLASLPSADVEENAAIVNALQRHAAVVVQKSLREGFGLTVTEAMWKGRPVVASAVGGIQDQIEDGVSGLLLPDPRDLGAFANALERLLADPPFARRLGERAREHVRERFLGVRHLREYAELLTRLESLPAAF
jgi:trehalose synthase